MAPAGSCARDQCLRVKQAPYCPGSPQKQLVNEFCCHVFLPAESRSHPFPIAGTPVERCRGTG